MGWKRRRGDGVKPGTGAEPGNKVSNGARDGRALTDTTLEEIETSAKRSGVEREELEFCG